MKIKIKKLTPRATIPFYTKQGDAGLDLKAINHCYNVDYDFHEFGTGLAIEIPPGHVGLVFPRSSISKTPHSLCNAVAVFDSGYRGEIKLRFRSIKGRECEEYMVGDRIGQLVILPYPQIEFEEVNELSESERGSSGFGDSGR